MLLARSICPSITPTTFFSPHYFTNHIRYASAYKQTPKPLDTYQGGGVLLVDVNHHLYRLDKSLVGGKYNMSVTPDVPTFASYTFARVVLRVLRHVKPTHCALIFDRKNSFWRLRCGDSQAFENTEKPTTTLLQQLEQVKEFAEAISVPWIQSNDYDAHDLIATYNELARQKEQKVVIMSEDKVLSQLVKRDNVHIFHHHKDGLLGEEYVQERYGVKPSMLPILLAVAGIQSYGAPTIKGVGPRIMADLINEFGVLNNILSVDLNTLTTSNDMPKIMKLRILRTQQDQVCKSLEKLTLKHQLPVEVPFEKLKVGTMDPAQWKAYVDKYKLATLASVKQEW